MPLLDSALSFIARPFSLSTRIARALPGLSFPTRVRWDALDRPEYAYGVWYAASLARAIGVKRIRVAELGVAGGNGLLALENIASLAEEWSGITIDVFGFDTGEGMPVHQDVRDLPYVWRTGFYRMNAEALQPRLKRAKLLLGDVQKTLSAWLADSHIPVGFVSFDMDYYSSTSAALSAFQEAPSVAFLPRCLSYFDDTIGGDEQIHCAFVGELLAIEEFNRKAEAARAPRRIAPVHGLSEKRRIRAPWNAQMHCLHLFDHPEYSKYVFDTERQLQLRG